MQIESSPKKTYRTMAILALCSIGLLGVAIYSLSHLTDPTQNKAYREELTREPDLQLLDTPQLLPELPSGFALKKEDFVGSWTLLTFWAQWCGPCLQELPSLNQFNQQWQDPRFKIISINVDPKGSESIELARAYLVDNEISLPCIFGFSKLAEKNFGVTDLPRHFLINPKAEIAWTSTGAYNWTGAKTRDALLKIVEASVDEAAATQ